jgi:hypothetical protein
MRKTNGWRPTNLSISQLTTQPDPPPSCYRRIATTNSNQSPDGTVDDAIVALANEQPTFGRCGSPTI